MKPFTIQDMDEKGLLCLRFSFHRSPVKGGLMNRLQAIKKRFDGRVDITLSKPYNTGLNGQTL